MLDRPLDVTGKIYRHTILTFPDAVKEFLTQVSNHAVVDANAKISKMRIDDVRQVEQVCGQMMSTFGYAKKL